MTSSEKAIFQNFADILLEHMPVAVALYDAQDFRLLAANTLFHSLLNPAWQNGRALGHPPADWVVGANVTTIENMLRRVVETGIPYRANELAIHSSFHGTTYWALTIEPVRDNDEHIIQLLQTANDVTTQVMARQKAEQTSILLSQTNSKAEAERKRLEVIETVARSVRTSLDLDSIGKAAVEVISTSFHALRLTIHVADSAQRKLDLLPGSLYFSPGNEPQEQTINATHHIHYDTAWLMSEAYKHRNPIILEDLQATDTFTTIKSDNTFHVVPGARSYICVPLWFKDNFEGTLAAIFGYTIRSDGPEVQALLGSGTHIAAALAHSRLHAALENQHARLRAILDQLPEGVLLVEASSGCISYANLAASQILGVPLTSLIDFPLNHYPQAPPVTNTDNQPMLPWNFAVIRALSGEAMNSQETIVTRPGGSKVVILASTAPLRNENGLITGAVIVFQDITARKSLEQQKQEFLSIASHELRTPITAIQGFAEILQLLASREQRLDDPRILHAIGSITVQSERLTHLIEDMLDITRLQHIQLSLNLAPHDLLAILNRVLESQATTTRQHHLQLVLDRLESTDSLVGWFDQERIEQVLTNLLSNAIKYSPAGGQIELGLRPLGNRVSEAREVLIWVRDWGMGISAGELPHIFERFHRASTLDRSISGLGIGLYLAKELVERHRGRIWVESSEGQGSKFYVRLPLQKGAD